MRTNCSGRAQPALLLWIVIFRKNCSDHVVPLWSHEVVGAICSLNFFMNSVEASEISPTCVFVLVNDPFFSVIRKWAFENCHPFFSFLNNGINTPQINSSKMCAKCLTWCSWKNSVITSQKPKLEKKGKYSHAFLDFFFFFFFEPAIAQMVGRQSCTDSGA